MIKSFKNKHTEKLFHRQNVSKVPSEIRQRAYKKLLILDAVIDLDDLRIPPSNHLEALTGDRAGQHSIRVNKKYRICFIWENGNAFDVELIDYH